MEEKEGGGAEATCRLDDEGDDGSVGKGLWGVDPGVVLALRPFVRGCCSVLVDMGVDWCFLEGSTIAMSM
jgi:hypothetical protein